MRVLNVYTSCAGLTVYRLCDALLLSFYFTLTRVDLYPFHKIIAVCHVLYKHFPINLVYFILSNLKVVHTLIYRHGTSRLSYWSVGLV